VYFLDLRTIYLTTKC